METCGAVANMDKVTGKLTIWTTTQAPHAHRTLYAIVAGLPEHKIQVISPDIGGGFGNKVGIYPGYVCAIVGSIVTGAPVKWVEDRSENLMSTSFARDYHMKGSIAASAMTASVVQLFTGTPSSHTVQAPQLDVSQPQWVPVRSRTTRR
jgi:carbon-monoxide dehydrogenase large subunit